MILSAPAFDGPVGTKFYKGKTFPWNGMDDKPSIPNWLLKTNWWQ